MTDLVGRWRVDLLGVLALVAVLIVGGVSPASASPGHADQERETSCQTVRIPVVVGKYSSHIGGTLCSPGPLRGRTLQVLVPGYTYGQVYWDFPYQPGRYSYERSANAAGYATLNIDRLGIGESGYPPAAAVTFDAQVGAIKQVVATVRAGLPSSSPPGSVVLVGHSYGSGAVSAAAIEGADVDGLILSGYTHVLGYGLAQFLALGSYPAALEPRFANRPPGYLTTIPGTRGTGFYAPGTYDPQVLAIDERTKQTLTPFEIAGVGLLFDRLLTRNVRVPVLVAAGDRDSISCGTGFCMAAERAFWSDEACLETLTVPRTGHDLNLSLTSRQWFAAATSWADRRIGVTGDPSEPCTVGD